MALFSSLRDTFDIDVGDEVSSLRKEVASLRRQLSRQGRKAYAATGDHASDIYDELSSMIADALPVVRRRAHDAGQVVRDNQNAIIVGAAVVGLIALLAATRRR